MATVEELEQQLQAAKEAEREAQRAKAQEIERAKGLKEAELVDGYMESLAEALRKKEITCTVRKCKVNERGGITFASISFPEKTEAYDYHHAPEISRRSQAYSSNWSYQIQFGSWTDKSKTYPRLKDGTFNYEKIAEDFSYAVGVEAARTARRNQESANYDESSKLAKALESEFPDHYPVSVSGCNESAEQVKIRLEAVYAPSEARQILKVITGITATRKANAEN